MFKPLLKSIPSLSGNMKIVCKLEGYNKDSSNKSLYNCNVNNALLTSLSNDLYDKNIPLNLQNNSFEYDIKKFYLYYSNVFYKTNFNYSKVNIPVIDFTSNLNDNNSDFKYGCKRVSYLKSRNQLAFYTPIYIEGEEDIKGKYFVISCTFNKVYKLTKYIKIKISNINEGNSLAEYLTRYASKIDDNVIGFSTSYKNIYYGIDVRNGGFIKVEDNISQNLYNKYFTINDFDATINNGFQRNYMIMKQVLPLSFYFDPYNLLDSYEKKIYNNSEIVIRGKWYDGNNEEIPFYDFSDDYSHFEENIFNLYYNDKFKYLDTGKNIMDIKYPACNEASSENYKYINTVAKNYNRWKLKYSSDLYPYIINNNYAFSYNQNSLYHYKEFPIMYSAIRAYAKLVSNTQYNMIFDLEDIFGSDYKLLNNKNQYFNLFNQKYICDFFNLFVKKDLSEEYINIFDDKYSDFWSNVNKDGKVYHKGILYDLNSIYNENNSMDYKIDKFGVFVKPEFSYTTSAYFNDKYKTCKTILSYDFTEFDSDNYLDHYQMNSKFSYLSNYGIAIKDENGPYIDLFDLGIRQYDKNQYIDANDIYIINLLVNNKKIDLEKSLKIDNEKIQLKLIEGYKLIESSHPKNIYDSYFEEIKTLFGSNKKITDSNIIFREEKYKEIESIYWAHDKLYFSIYPNKAKYSLIDNYEILKDIDNSNLITLYYKTQFVQNNSDLTKYLRYYNIQDNTSVSIDHNKDKRNISDVSIDINYHKYFYSTGLYDKKQKILYTSPIFRELNDITNNYGNNIDNTNDKNYIYVDPYNLNNIYQIYLNKKYPIDNDSTLKEFYCKFLNIEHIRLYENKLCKNRSLSGSFSINNIFIKVRNFNNIIIDLKDNKDFSTITLQDDYIPIKNFGLNNIGDICKYLEFDELLNCFSFNNDYFVLINKMILIFNYWAHGVLNNHLDELKELTDLGYTFSNIISIILIVVALYNVKNFEVCFKKEMLPLNEDLYKLIINRKNNDIFKDLYLYHIQNSNEFKHQLNYNSSKHYIINSIDNVLDKEVVDYTFKTLSGFTNTISNYNQNIIYDYNNLGLDITIHSTNNITFTLEPYFNEIYDENYVDTKIYSDYFINNIIECKIDENNKRYRYNEASIDLLAYIPKGELSDQVEDLLKQKNSRYSIITNIDDRFIHYDKDYLITNSEFSNIANIVDNPENFNEFSNLITYSYNGINYGFYMIGSYFDNTNNTLNIQNEDLDYINCVDYINEVDVSKFNDYSYSYLGGMYKNILPYINTSNPVKFALNNIKTLIKPKMFKLKHNINQYVNTDDINRAYSYTLYNTKRTSYIELLRYFDNIVPYTPEYKYMNSYCLYYKDTTKMIENDLYNSRNSYIMYKQNLNINKFSYISYFDVDLNINKYEPTEYKHYNYNKFFNLEKEIIIKLSQEFDEQGIIEYEKTIDYESFEDNESNISNNKIFNLFISYINNSDFDVLPYKDKINNYLFLYKKYEVKFIQDFKYINSSNKKVYSLTIKFNLL